MKNPIIFDYFEFSTAAVVLGKAIDDVSIDWMGHNCLVDAYCYFVGIIRTKVCLVLARLALFLIDIEIILEFEVQ